MGGRGVIEAQDEGLSLQEKQCTQKLPSRSRIKSRILQAPERHREASHCPMSILRASSGPQYFTSTEKFHKLFSHYHLGTFSARPCIYHLLIVPV